MSRYIPDYDAAAVRHAVAAWSEACLRRDRSVLDADASLWTSTLLDELNRHFVQNLNAGEGKFLEKLRGQLDKASAPSRRLMAEMLWILLLFPSNITAASKRGTVREAWSWSGSELPADHSMLSDAVLRGLGSAGRGYNTFRYLELVFLIDAVSALKAMEAGKREGILADGWAFSTWLADLPSSVNRQLRNILPHLLFPDQFERISSLSDKAAILGALTSDATGAWSKRSLVEVDRALLELRTELETKAGQPIDFYGGDLRPQWRTPEVPDNPMASLDPVPEAPERPQSITASSVRASLNVILHGPPGTGKTFATMRKAVEICDGQPRGPRPGDEAIKARYDELREAARIAFVTFHQSFSYEDFVEGLRPETDAQDGAGFRLVARPGILREMADLAAKGRTAQPSDAALDERRVFKMSLGRAHNEDDAYIFEDCIEGGQVLLGWGGAIDWGDRAYATFAGILARWQQVEPGATGNNFNVKAIWSLRNDMREGDVVVVSNGNSTFRAVGVIEGPYEFVERAEGTSTSTAGGSGGPGSTRWGCPPPPSSTASSRSSRSTASPLRG